MKHGEANQDVSGDGHHADYELCGDVQPFTPGLETIRHLCRAAARSPIHDERVKVLLLLKSPDFVYVVRRNCSHLELIQTKKLNYKC